MGVLDDDDDSVSEYDSSLSSNGDWDTRDHRPGAKAKSAHGKKVAKSPPKKIGLPTGPSVVEGDIETRLNSIRHLKASLGMKDEVKVPKVSSKREENRRETEAMQGLGVEERVRARSHSVDDMMARIRLKREQALREAAEKQALREAAEKQAAQPNRQPQRRESVGSLGGCSVESADTAESGVLDDNQLAEFRRLKAKKERRTKKRGTAVAPASGGTKRPGVRRTKSSYT